MSAARGKPLGMGRKETILHLRVSVDEMDAWVRAARLLASEESWDSPDRALSRWVRRMLNQAVKGGAK